MCPTASPDSSVPRDMLDSLGVRDVTDIIPHRPGWGDTVLWRVRRSTTPADLLLRIFPRAPERVAQREVLAHQAAANAGIPVPAVIASGQVGPDAAMVMTWSAGETASDVLKATPDRAYDLGYACGDVLARIHAIPAPPDLSEVRSGDWIAWAGPVADRLRPALTAASKEASADRLLHLDYHPDNILVVDGQVSAVLDWANTRPGDPRADLARTRSIFRLVAMWPDLRDLVPVIETFERGFMAGHAAVCGPVDDLPLFDAWAMAVQVADLAPKVGQPGVWLTPEAIDRLRAERDRLVAQVL